MGVSETKAPSPGPNDVHIRVKAAGLNFADTLQIAGRYQSKLEPPFIPGMEVAGEIIGIGQALMWLRDVDKSNTPAVQLC